MISKEEVQHIAKLARLGLSSAEIKKLQGELSKILDYVEKLKEVDIAGVEPMSHSVLVENIMREDRIDEKRKLQNGKFLELALNSEKGYLKVKSILK
ncbi:MAG: Asp-tRNA(Asn)/Glu-tRNA(Gln) amidotransferase subunit GatC [Patescibacteria group bacterium]